MLWWVGGRGRGVRVLLAEGMVESGGRVDGRGVLRWRGRLLLERLVGGGRAAGAGGAERRDGAVAFRWRGRLLLERFVGGCRAARTGGGGRISTGEVVHLL